MIAFQRRFGRLILGRYARGVDIRGGAGRSLRPLSEPFFIRTGLLKNVMGSGTAWRERSDGARTRFCPKDYLFVVGKIITLMKPASEGKKFRFIAQIHDGVDPLDTELYQRFCAGERITRRGAGRKDRLKGKLTSKEDFLSYARRVEGLLESVASCGVRPITEIDPDNPDLLRGEEGDIGIAISGRQIALFCRGSHRFAAAQAVGVERIPCQCYFVSTEALGELAGRDCSDATEEEMRRTACDYLEALD